MPALSVLGTTPLFHGYLQELGSQLILCTGWRTSGAQVVHPRSGTTISGKVFEYFRHDALEPTIGLPPEFSQSRLRHHESEESLVTIVRDRAFFFCLEGCVQHNSGGYQETCVDATRQTAKADNSFLNAFPVQKAKQLGISKIYRGHLIRTAIQPVGARSRLSESLKLVGRYNYTRIRYSARRSQQSTQSSHFL